MTQTLDLVVITRLSTDLMSHKMSFKRCESLSDKLSVKKITRTSLDLLAYLAMYRNHDQRYGRDLGRLLNSTSTISQTRMRMTRKLNPRSLQV
jgi:pantothenate kinase